MDLSTVLVQFSIASCSLYFASQHPFMSNNCNFDCMFSVLAKQAPTVGPRKAKFRFQFCCTFYFLDFMVTNWLLRVWYCIANCHVPFCCETLCHSCRSLTRISWKHLKPFSWIPWGLSPHIAASAFVHSCQVNLSRPEVEGLLTALSRAQQGNLTCNYQCVVKKLRGFLTDSYVFSWPKSK